MQDHIAISHLEDIQKRNEQQMLGDLYQEEYRKSLDKGIRAIKVLQKVGKWVVRQTDDDYLFPEILKKEETCLGTIPYEIAQSSVYLIVTEKKKLYLAFPSIIWTNDGVKQMWNTIDWKQGWGRPIHELDVIAYTELPMTADTYGEICSKMAEIEKAGIE